VTELADVRVWDPLLRLCHWSFALLSLRCGGRRKTPNGPCTSGWAWCFSAFWHFRVLWGFVGPETARFASFIRGPKTVAAYLARQLADATTRIGHSPLGGWSTLVLIGAMLTQVGMGLFSGDPYDGMTGPLNPLVGVMTADTITELHETFFWVLGRVHRAASCSDHVLRC
jgi:cytochrome b